MYKKNEAFTVYLFCTKEDSEYIDANNNKVDLNRFKDNIFYQALGHNIPEKEHFEALAFFEYKYMKTNLDSVPDKYKFRNRLRAQNNEERDKSPGRS